VIPNAAHLKTLGERQGRNNHHNMQNNEEKPKCKAPVDALKGGVRGGHSAVSPDNGQLRQTIGVSGEPAVRSRWPKGLTNVGNTCYANAALQCLLSTSLTTALLDPTTVPILRRYSSNPNLLSMGSGSVDSDEGEVPATPRSVKQRERVLQQQRKEKEQWKMHELSEWLTKELTQITNEYVSAGPESFGKPNPSVMGWLSSQQPVDAAINPGSITKHPDRLSKCLRPYQQEDAHEFLRALISTLVMNGHNKKLSSLFDGLLESAVTCRSCGRASLTRDRYMDISLDINDPQISSLDDALYEYTKTELLDGDNLVFCQKCQKKRSVTKGLRLATAPSILVCHLKRFAFDNYGRLIRLHKTIEFPTKLEIGDFMSNLNKARPPPYDLVGILVHQGQTCASGHYLAFVKKNGEWFKCNDSVVTKVDEATVLSQQAYIMMYEVAEMRESCTPRTKLKRQLSHPMMNSDEPELMKDELTGHATSFSSRRNRTSTPEPAGANSSVGKLLQFLVRAEGGVTQFLADMCCDSTNNGLNEPKTRQMKRRDRKKRQSHSSDVTKSFSSEEVKVIEVERKQAGRSQTAPRQRIHSYDAPATFELISPHTTFSPPDHFRRGKVQRDDREVIRSRKDRARFENRDLPPLPRHRRATSQVSGRRKGGYMA
jgi:hypothetical protein